MFTYIYIYEYTYLPFLFILLSIVLFCLFLTFFFNRQVNFLQHNLSSCVSLGEDAPIDELEDFIAATHIADEIESDVVWTNNCHDEKKEVENLMKKLITYFVGSFLFIVL